MSCTVDNHHLKGGGLYVTGGAYAYVIYSLFSLNEAGMGGGVLAAWYAMLIETLLRALLISLRFWHGGWKFVKV
mgnify:CR=1 FL=1